MVPCCAVCVAGADDKPQRANESLKSIQGVPAAATLPSKVLDETPRIRALCDEARDLIDGGDAERASEVLDAALNTGEGDYFEVHYLLARAKARSERFGEARAAASVAARLRPGAADVHYLLGNLHRRQRNRDQAIRHYRTATLAAEREPNNVRVTAAWFRLGEVLAREGYLRAAAEAYERFDVAIWDSHAEHRGSQEVSVLIRSLPRGAVELRLDLLHRAGRDGEAIATASWALEHLPADARLERLYARALMDGGEAVRALTYCRERIADGKPWRLLRTAVSAARAAGRLGEWIDNTVTAVKEDRDVDLALSLARTLDAGESHAAAVRIWEALSVRRPLDAEVGWSLAAAHKRAGNLREALASLIAYVRADPESNDAPHARLADWLATFEASDEFAELVGGFRKQAEADYATDFVLGSVAAAAGQRALAEKLFGAALASRADFALAHVAWGRMLLAAYQWEPAADHARQALEINPKLPAAHFVLGEALDGLDRTQECEQAFKKAIELRPDEPAYALALARHHRRVGPAVAAQRYYHQAFSLAPRSAEAAEGLVQSYLGSNKLEIARTQFKKCEQAGVEEGALRRMRTLLRLADDGFGQAQLDELRRQLELHPDDLSTGLFLGRVLFTMGQVAEAAEVARKIRASAPNEERVLILLSRVLKEQLEYEQAADILQRLAERYPNRRKVLARLADLYLADFRLEEARRVLRHMLELDGELGTRQLLLGSYVEFAEFDVALGLLDEWLAEEPSAEALFFNRLDVLVKAGRADEAVEAASKWLSDSPADPVRRRFFVNTCLAAAQFERAERTVRKWLEDASGDVALTGVLVDVLLAGERADDALRVVDSFRPQRKNVEYEWRFWRARCLSAAQRTDEALSEIDAMMDERLFRSRADLSARGRGVLVLILLDARLYERGLRRCADWLSEQRPGNHPARFEVLLHRHRFLQAAEREEEWTELSERMLKFNIIETGLTPISFRRVQFGLKNDLGYTWVDAGKNLKRAAHMIREAVADQPWNPAYLDSLGWAYYKTGEFAEARKHLLRSLRLPGGADPVVQDHLGDAEYRLGDVKSARDGWQKAVELIEREDREDSPLPGRIELKAALTSKLGALEASAKPAVAPTGKE